MSSKRDLVEAHSFSRRRLVTAFVSGAPGGREVEPVRPGRMVVGGVAIAVLLVAGAAVAGQISPRTPSNWLEPGIVISKETGSSYAVLEDKSLHPLANPISGQLLYGPGLGTSTVRQEEINKQDIGTTIGIYGAPDNLPTSDQLVGSGWTACTNGEGGLKFHVAAEPQVTPSTANEAAIVASGRDHYLLAPTPSGVVRLALPADGGLRTKVTNQVGLAGADPVRVTDEWLALFPGGPALDDGSFPVDRLGRRASYAGELGDESLTVGTLVEFRDGRVYLLGDDAPVPLSPFSVEAYRALVDNEEPRRIDVLGGDIRDQEPLWPDATVTRFDGQLCTVLTAAPGRPAYATLASSPVGDADATRIGKAVQTSVDPGRGAYVRVAGHGDARGGQQVVIDAQGRRFRLGGPGEDTATRLGYGSYDPPTVPDSWVERFGCGPELSREAALLPPDPRDTCRER